jgi:hypothetical protein
MILAFNCTPATVIAVGSLDSQEELPKIHKLTLVKMEEVLLSELPIR